ncbi:MAG: hypothetical protein IPL26_21965 [Leptospiraceae bacterium]|nr:hypothetical protein [Leptospiraceae bacterium]
MILRILENANELINSIACGSKPTARCKPQVEAGLTLRKVSELLTLRKIGNLWKEGIY